MFHVFRKMFDIHSCEFELLKKFPCLNEKEVQLLVFLELTLRKSILLINMFLYKALRININCHGELDRKKSP